MMLVRFVVPLDTFQILSDTFNCNVNIISVQIPKLIKRVLQLIFDKILKRISNRALPNC